jgi:TonB family protein
MNGFGKGALIVLGVLVALGLAYRVDRSQAAASGGDSTTRTAIPGDDDAQPLASGYVLSNEVLDPWELRRNPFKWKGHSGILDTARISMAMPDGQRAHIPYPGGGLHFDKMLDEHTASFDVIVGGYDAHEDGELIVLLEDSDPPNPLRPWRVYVEGPYEGVNALGGAVRDTAVRFEGYYEPPPEPVRVQPPPAAVQVEQQDSAAEGGGLRAIGGSVSAPVLLSAPEPEFSEEARTARVTGEVIVHLEVEEDGSVSNVYVVRSLGSGLDEKAVEAVQQYKFKPALDSGKPVAVEMKVKVNFQSF